MQQRRHKSCREKLEEATFDILHEMHDENTTLSELKKKFSRALEIIKCLHCELSITQREYEILHEAIPVKGNRYSSKDQGLYDAGFIEGHPI